MADQRSPLLQLLHHIHDEGIVPDTWVAAHAPDGSLAEHWAICEDVSVMVNLAGLCTDARSLARAACASARLIVSYLPMERVADARAALDVAERWASGDAVDPDELVAAAMAADHSYANVERTARVVSCAACSVDAAVCTAAVGAGVDTRGYGGLLGGASDRRRDERQARHGLVDPFDRGRADRGWIE